MAEDFLALRPNLREKGRAPNNRRQLGRQLREAIFVSPNECLRGGTNYPPLVGALPEPQASHGCLATNRFEENTAKPSCATIIACRTGDRPRLELEKRLRRLLHQRYGFQAPRCLDWNIG
jgi:hypothetical protein